MDKIINIVGASGSGKTTVARELEGLGYNVIQSYTTRPPRYENEWGHTFVDGWTDENDEGIWVEFDKYAGLICWDKIIAYFNNYNKDEHYFATRKQYRDKGTSIYIVDPDGAEQVKKNVDDAEVITVYLQADYETRENRLIERRDNVDAIYDRLYDDYNIFRSVKCDYVIDANRSVEDVVNSVLGVI